MGVVAGDADVPVAGAGRKARHIDPRSDLFRMGPGILLMRTGRPPFRATGTIAVLKACIEERPRPIREINPSLPEWLSDLITKLQPRSRSYAIRPREKWRRCLASIWPTCSSRPGPRAAR